MNTLSVKDETADLKLDKQLFLMSRNQFEFQDFFAAGYNAGKKGEDADAAYQKTLAEVAERTAKLKNIGKQVVPEMHAIAGTHSIGILVMTDNKPVIGYISIPELVSSIRAELKLSRQKKHK